MIPKSGYQFSGKIMRNKVHDPEKWVPVSRLREALATAGRFRLNASAGEGRSGEIMRN